MTHYHCEIPDCEKSSVDYTTVKSLRRHYNDEHPGIKYPKAIVGTTDQRSRSLRSLLLYFPMDFPRCLHISSWSRLSAEGYVPANLPTSCLWLCTYCLPTLSFSYLVKMYCAPSPAWLGTVNVRSQ